MKKYQRCKLMALCTFEPRLSWFLCEWGRDYFNKNSQIPGIVNIGTMWSVAEPALAVIRIRKATESGLGSVWESLICSSLSVIPLELGSGPHLCYHLHLRLHSVQPTWSRPTYPTYLQSIICQHLLLLPIWSFNPSLRSNSLSPFCLWRYLFYW